ncbi:Rieske (2Fe-2S) protein [Komagataeibacter xylinus]
MHSMKQAPSGSRALCTVSAALEAPQRVMCAGRAVVVWMVEGDRPAVIDDRCPHGNARLSDGYVLYGRIVCPLHMWTFGADGHAQAPGGRMEAAGPMPQAYESWISEDEVWARVDG